MGRGPTSGHGMWMRLRPQANDGGKATAAIRCNLVNCAYPGPGHFCAVIIHGGCWTRICDRAEYRSDRECAPEKAWPLGISNTDRSETQVEAGLVRFLD
jgi:hypothetical protein